MKNKLDETSKLVKDIQSISVRNPSNMTWRQIGETLYAMGWRKTFAERTQYMVTEDDVETALLMLTNLADEIDGHIINDPEITFTDKTHFALQHLRIYQLYGEISTDNDDGSYTDIWEKFKKLKKK